MTARADVLSRLSDGGSGDPLWLPDVAGWYNWHRRAGTIPARWKGHSLPDISRALGTPVWMSVKPWQMETPGVEIVVEERDGERLIRYETSARTLLERWSLGPDGDWWQMEYPVKTDEDLPAARELVEARTYVFAPDEWKRMDALVGDSGVVALEIPRRPYSEVLHALLGWSEGLMLLLGDGREAIVEIIAILEDKVQACVRQVLELPGAVVFGPDNLDGQFITPGVFRDHLADSYRATADTLHGAGKRLLVHAGGPIRRLLAPLAAAGVDGIEGVSGPPQGDASLAEARGLAGRRLTLWGGIPQDYLLPAHDAAAFEAAVTEAARQCKGDGRMILGVADMVPVDADIARLQAVPLLIAQAGE